MVNFQYLIFSAKRANTINPKMNRANMVLAESSPGAADVCRKVPCDTGQSRIAPQFPRVIILQMPALMAQLKESPLDSLWTDS